MTTVAPRRAFDGIVLDVEGTTTPVSFVYEVLFPYARERLTEYVRAHSGELADVVALVEEEWRGDVARGESVPAAPADGDPDAVGWIAYLEWLMERDRKSPGLKLVQGRIWDGGFAAGVLRGLVYPDVAPALERWRAAGVSIAIYSSGSVLAQRQLFAHSTSGDLSQLIDHYFDTGVGAKRDPGSYRRIAGAMHRSPDCLLFVSDVPAELDAARDAGMQTRLCVRDVPFVTAGGHVVVKDFEAVAP